MKITTKRLFFIIILLTIIDCNSFEFLNSDDDYKIHYTMADILNVRKNPSINSEVINQIPYGTKINTKNMKIQEIYDGKKSSWHFVKETNGFVLDYFLAKQSEIKNSKKFTLKLSYSFLRCNPYGIGIYKTLILSNNESNMKDEFIDFIHGDRKILSGVYNLKNNSIQLEMKEIELQKVDYSEGKSIIIEKNRSKNQNIIIVNLIWKEQIKGFITEDQEKYLDTEKYKLDIKKCIFTNKKCKEYDPFKEKCTEERENSDVCDDVGYYCNR
ncbi:SH3 domain-containing protein [Leptospira bouyouniensis]|uniref:SH3 domain-containing protein n=1 Tax=Leptospira bouyouniensis TaxID=2484911 RepID=UPI0010912D0D|nr:SH3 domain-containing protein [Leptospira bouyouniensis]TGM85080.1 SH3 domain-containing protein [Leptospira bouyouniensis]